MFPTALCQGVSSVLGFGTIGTQNETSTTAKNENRHVARGRTKQTNTFVGPGSIDSAGETVHYL